MYINLTISPYLFVTSFINLKTTLLDELSKVAPKEVIVDINMNEDLIKDINAPKRSE